MRYFALALFCLPLAGQITGLTTDSSGSVLYFSTTYRQSGTQQPFHGKLFRWDSTNGLRLHTLIERVDGVFNGNDFLFNYEYTNSYDLSQPQLGSDGRRLVFNHWYFSRNYVIGSATLAEEGHAPRLFEGRLYLSPSGRFAAMRPWSTLRTASPPISELFDLEDLGAEPVSFVDYSGEDFTRRRVSNAGSVIVTDWNGKVRLITANSSTNFSTNSSRDLFDIDLRRVKELRFDPQGRFVLFTQSGANLPAATPRRIFRYTLSSNIFDPVSAAGADCFSPELSEDGGTLLMLCSDNTGQPQAYLLAAGQEVPTALFAYPGGIRQALLSADASVAYFVSSSEEILRLHIASGEAQLVLPSSTRLDLDASRAIRVSAGSLHRFTGNNLRASAGAKLEILAGDIALPIVRLEDQQVWVQIPPDFPILNTPLKLTFRGLPPSLLEAPAPIGWILIAAPQLSRREPTLPASVVPGLRGLNSAGPLRLRGGSVPNI